MQKDHYYTAKGSVKSLYSLFLFCFVCLAQHKSCLLYAPTRPICLSSKTISNRGWPTAFALSTCICVVTVLRIQHDTTRRVEANLAAKHYGPVNWNNSLVREVEKLYSAIVNRLHIGPLAANCNRGFQWLNHDQIARNGIETVVHPTWGHYNPV